MQDKLTASAVGSIVGMRSEEIQQIASHYEEKVSHTLHIASVFLVFFFIFLCICLQTIKQKRFDP